MWYGHKIKLQAGKALWGSKNYANIACCVTTWRIGLEPSLTNAQERHTCPGSSAVHLSPDPDTGS